MFVSHTHIAGICSTYNDSEYPEDTIILPVVHMHGSIVHVVAMGILYTCS